MLRQDRRREAMDSGRTFWVLAWMASIYVLACLPAALATNPSPPCQANIVYAEPSQSVIVDYQYTSQSAQYNVSILDVNPPTNTSFTVGATNVSVDYMYPGASSINETCNFTVTVIEFTCPPNVMLESGPGITSASATWSPATEEYSTEFPILYTPANGTSLPLGDNTIRGTAYATGQPNISCTFIVSVAEDLTPPVFSDVFDVLTFNNSQTPSWRLNASDNSNVVTITSSPSPGSYFPLGNTTVTVTATDNAGLTTTQNFTVQVVSDGSPEISNCPGDQPFSLAPTQVPLAVTWDVPTAVTWDVPTTPGGITPTSDYAPNAMFNEGTTKVTYKFTDDAGRSSKCFFKIKITLNADETSPLVESCPTGVSVTVPAGTEQTMVTWDEPVFNDAVSGMDLDIQQSKQSGSNFTEGSTEVLYSAMDGNFNPAYCMFSVTVNVVEDNDSPVIVGCPTDFTHWVTVGETMVTVSWVAPNITDDSPFTVQVSHTPGSVFTVGTDTVVSYVATDIVNNMNDCTFTVSVTVDTVDPVLDCPPNINMFVADGTMIAVTWPTPNATDNSGEVTVTSRPPSGTSFLASVSGQNDVVNVMAADPYGNDAMCSFVVNVKYDVAPVLTCPNVLQPTVTGQATASATWPDVIITDDYTMVSALINSSSHGSIIDKMRYDVDPVAVTLTAEDEQANIGTCTFTVDVVDQEKPLWVNCPSNITQMAEVGTNSKVVTWTRPTVSDNSGKAPIENNNPPTSQTYSGGIWPVVYTATDDSGNIGTCEFYVTIIVDDDVPVFDNCPSGQVSVNSDPDTNSAVVDWVVITATDNAGATTVTSNYATGQRLDIGSYNVVYQARDINGNVAFCRFTAIVLDGEAPGFISCPDTFSVPILDSQPMVIVTWTEPMFVDNSIQGSVTAMLSLTSSRPGSKLGRGAHLIQYIATDAQGNMASTCSFTINVVVTTDTIELEGEVLLDIVRGINGNFNPSVARQGDLRDDLDELFRIASSLAPDFVGIQIRSTTFDVSNNFRVQFSLHLRNPSYYNEEEIKQAFYSALTDNVNFAITNTIVPASFDLHVREFRGQLSLVRISAANLSNLFDICCSDPTSTQYLNLEGRVHLNLRLTFMSLLGFKMVKSLRFTQGSVVVPYTITLGDDSIATITQADTIFTNAVDATFEWIPGGTSSDLFLDSLSMLDVLPTEEVCPSSFVCMNGGTCTVSNVTYIYDHQCSCASGTSGDNCENTGIVLSTAAIIGIVCGVLGFLLILLFICCCCFLFLSGSRGSRRDAEYGRKAAPLMLMPRDDYIYRRPPIMDRPGPIITEVEEAHEGPYFMHESDDYRAPAPLPLAIEPAPRYKIPPPVTLGPQFEHEYDDHIPPPRRGDRSRAHRFRDMLPDRLPRARRRDDFGPRFQGDSRPERVEDMKRRLYREFNY